MQVELSVALNFVISYLYNKLPRRRVDMFCEELEKGLRRKFEGHWYPDEPFKGNGFRCIRVNGEKVDPVFAEAARASGLSVDEIQDYLPKSLTVWMDPGEVSYRIGESAPVKVLYCTRRSSVGGGGCTTRDPDPRGLTPTGSSADITDQEVQHASQGFNPCAASFRPVTLGISPTQNNSSSWLGVGPTISNGSGSPVTGPMHGSNSTSPVTGVSMFSRSLSHPGTGLPAFTAAQFAQTKFGSTKMKTQAQRPSRLSPTEFSGGVFLSSPTGGMQTVPARSPISPLDVVHGNTPGGWPAAPATPVQLNHCLQSPTAGGSGMAAVGLGGGGFLQLSPLQQCSPLFGIRGDPRIEYMKNHQQRLLLIQQQQQLHQQLQQQQQQQQLNLQQLKQQQMKLLNQVTYPQNSSLLNSSVASHLTGSSKVNNNNNNSIAASLQSLYEQQQREQHEQQQQENVKQQQQLQQQQEQQQQQQQQTSHQPQHQRERSRMNLDLSSSTRDASTERFHHDPFQADPNADQTALDLLDWNALVAPYSSTGGGLHQLLVAN